MPAIDAPTDQLLQPSRLGWPSVLAIGLLCAGMACFVWWSLPAGPLTNSDELLTAERSREMELLHSPWTVWFNFLPTFRKPPLQYWLTMGALRRFREPETAVRFWPMVQAVVAAVLTGWLARVAASTRPLLAPLSVLFFVTCPLLLREAGRARLDIGLTCCVTLTVGAILLAQRRTDMRWWAVAAGACFLGALQKNPQGLLYWLLLAAAGFLLRKREGEEPGAMGTGARLGGGWFVLAALSTTCWPVLQMVHNAMPPHETFGLSEAATLTGAARLGHRGYFEVLDQLTTRWVWGTLVLLAAVAPLIQWGWAAARRRTSLEAAGTSRTLVKVSFVCVSFLALVLLAGFRSVRYVLPLLPCFCVLVSYAVHRLVETRRPWITCPLAALALWCFGLDFLHVRRRVTETALDALPQKNVAVALGLAMRQAAPGTQCLLVRHREDDVDHEKALFDAFYLFYGRLPGPVEERTIRQLRRTPLMPPCLGICAQEDLPTLREALPTVVVRTADGGFLCWEAAAKKPGEQLELSRP